jgi:hypothetical protein
VDHSSDRFAEACSFHGSGVVDEREPVAFGGGAALAGDGDVELGEQVFDLAQFAEQVVGVDAAQPAVVARGCGADGTS